MLRRLAVHHLALVDHLECAFDGGFTVLTGETGAGKSMILHALDLVLGARASSDDVQQGAPQAVVEALFEIQQPKLAGWLMEKGYEAEDELVIRRVITKEGKSQAYVNGAMAPVGLLKEIGMWLADVHGQHEQQTLLRSGTHLDQLDAFGKLEGLRQTIEELYRDWHSRVMTREARVMDVQERARRLDLLVFQKHELESAGLQVGEEEKLEQERERLRHADALRRQAEEVYERLSGEGRSVTSAEQAARGLAEMAKYDKGLEAWAERCRQSSVELRDLAGDVRGYRDRVEANPSRLEEVEQRLVLLERLKRKYGSTIEEMQKFLIQVTASWQELVQYQQVQEEAVAGIQEAEEMYRREAQELSKRRKTTGTKFLRAVEEELKVLGMGHVTLEVRWTSSDRPTAVGLEQAEFLVVPNPGEAPKPLDKVASGGELSRIMLAFKVVLAKQDRVPTLIFDEIDAGVGGRTAEVIGRKLKVISRERQVICVTHMAQVASFADAHFQVAKEIGDHRTATHATKLSSKKAVVEELAKMIGGEAVTPVALKHAEELLNKAGQSTAPSHPLPSRESLSTGSRSRAKTREGG